MAKKNQGNNGGNINQNNKENKEVNDLNNRNIQNDLNNQAKDTSKADMLIEDKLRVLHENLDSYEWIPASQLMNNSEIQRMRNSQRVHKIVKNFNPQLVNPIKVSHRDGKYYVFDGAHTLAALIEIHRIRGESDFLVLCRVFQGLTLEDEARLFALQSGYVEAVQMGYRIRALEVAKDPEVLDFLHVTRESGLSIAPGQCVTHNGNIAAVVAAFKAYRELGAKEYLRMLKGIHRTWAGESWSITKYMLGGMARFLKMYEFNMNTFVKLFRHITYDNIVEGAAKYAGMTKDGAFAASIAEIFDSLSATPLQARV